VSQAVVLFYEALALCELGRVIFENNTVHIYLPENNRANLTIKVLLKGKAQVLLKGKAQYS
jgi:hypothetical protein